MNVSPPAAAVLQDTFQCLGLGLLLAAALDLLSLVCPGRAGRFFLDVLGFALAAVLLYAFSAGASLAGTPRWFHAAGLLAGVLAWFRAAVPLTARLRRRLYWLLGRPAALLRIWVAAPLVRQARALWRRVHYKKVKKTLTKPEKQLPKKQRMLYNSK